MRKAFSILIALSIAATVAVATIVPAMAWTFTDQVLLSCGGSQLGTGIAGIDPGSSGGVETDNTASNSCYWVYAAGDVELSGGSYVDLGSDWVGGGPGSVIQSPYYGNVIHTDGVHNLCNSDSSVCSGFTDTGVS